MAHSKLTVYERVLAMTVPITETGCWIFLGQLRGGYGRIKVGGRKGEHKSAHRITFEEINGAIPEGLQLDHLCRITCCVNPRHLEAVPAIENVRRGNSGKINTRKTNCPQGHPYDNVNTLFYTLKNRGRPGNLARMCRECSRKRTREWRLQRKQNKALN